MVSASRSGCGQVPDALGAPFIPGSVIAAGVTGMSASLIVQAGYGRLERPDHALSAAAPAAAVGCQA